MKKSFEWVLGLGAVFFIVLFIFFNLTSGLAETMKRESHVVVKHNVEGDELVTFKSHKKMNPNMDYFFMPSEEFINPHEDELENTLEVMIEKDGKTETLRFKSLTIVPEDVEELVVSFDPKDDLNKVDGILYVPSEKIIYE